MNRLEIQKSFKRICPPQYGEKQDAWFFRLSRCLGMPTNRIKSLYKDDRCKLSLDEGIQLRKHLGQPSKITNDKRLQENAELREELREIKQYLRARDEKFRTAMEMLFS